jgi:uncharacterized protein
MDFSEQWEKFLDFSGDAQGGALISGDGELITWATFGSSEHRKISAAGCVALMEMAQKLSHHTKRGDFTEMVLEGENGYLVLMPVIDKGVFVTLVRKGAKLGLALIDMRRAIDDFGPGLAGEFIIPPRPPKSGRAYARPSDG